MSFRRRRKPEIDHCFSVITEKHTKALVFKDGPVVFIVQMTKRSWMSLVLAVSFSRPKNKCRKTSRFVILLVTLRWWIQPCNSWKASNLARQPGDKSAPLSEGFHKNWAQLTSRPQRTAIGRTHLDTTQPTLPWVVVHSYLLRDLHVHHSVYKRTSDG
jgi:hypothetical protein